MRQLAKDIDRFLNEITLKAENQHEIPHWSLYQ